MNTEIVTDLATQLAHQLAEKELAKREEFFKQVVKEKLNFFDYLLFLLYTKLAIRFRNRVEQVQVRMPHTDAPVAFGVKVDGEMFWLRAPNEPKYFPARVVLQKQFS